MWKVFVPRTKTNRNFSFLIPRSSFRVPRFAFRGPRETKGFLGWFPHSSFSYALRFGSDLIDIRLAAHGDDMVACKENEICAEERTDLVPALDGNYVYAVLS